jgi:hypothetical protein
LTDLGLSLPVKKGSQHLPKTRPLQQTQGAFLFMDYSWAFMGEPRCNEVPEAVSCGEISTGTAIIQDAS